MIRVVVHDELDLLESDLRDAAAKLQNSLTRAVDSAQRLGTQMARAHAIAASGRHGKNFYKRITGEMLSSTSAEFGITADEHGQPVGAGFRHGPPNRDLVAAGDKAADELQIGVRGAIDGAFW
ncbi:MAG: hypothetical protein FWD95_01820 [Nocardioidaceae bacterium]|nr:hypothetical protein [Nocardioidaceae bacterium]